MINFDLTYGIHIIVSIICPRQKQCVYYLPPAKKVYIIWACNNKSFKALLKPIKFLILHKIYYALLFVVKQKISSHQVTIRTGTLISFFPVPFFLFLLESDLTIHPARLHRLPSAAVPYQLSAIADATIHPTQTPNASHAPRRSPSSSSGDRVPAIPTPSAIFGHWVSAFQVWACFHPVISF